MRILITESQFNRIMINEVRVKPNERYKIYEDDEWLVVAPLTHSASCKYGAGMPWCTATPSNSKKFDESILLIYILDKKDNTNKYAISYDDDLIEFNRFVPKESTFSWWDKHNTLFKGKNPFSLPDNIIELIFEYAYSKLDSRYYDWNNKQPIKNINGEDIRINQYDGDGNKQGYWEIKSNSGRISKGNFVNNEREGYWEYYHPNGNLYSKGSIKNGVRDGYWEQYWSNGELESKGSYKNGVGEGYWEYYYENGQLEKKGTYVDGKRNGYWEDFHKNGQLMSKGSYKNGGGEGYWKKYWDNGVLKSKGSIKNGDRDGYWEYYWENGELWYKGNYVDDKEDGLWEWYWENGQLEKKGTYVDGKRNGYWEFYHKNGELEKKGSYKNGLLIKK